MAEKSKQYTVVIGHKHTGKEKRVKIAAARIIVGISMKKLLEPGRNGKITVSAENMELRLDNYGDRRITGVKHRLQQEALQDPKFAKKMQTQSFGTVNSTYHHLDITTQELLSIIDEKLTVGVAENTKAIDTLTKQLQTTKERLEFFKLATKNFKKNRSLIRYTGWRS